MDEARMPDGKNKKRFLMLLVRSLFLSGLILSILGWALLLPKTRQQKIRPTAGWMKPLDSTWVLQSPGQPYSIQTASDFKKNGEDSLRFELRGGEKWVDQTFVTSFRSEVETGEFPPARVVQWYSFSVFFPTNFPLETNRLVFAQWHDDWHLLQPGRIPPLAFRFVNGRLSITLRHSADHFIRNVDDVPAEDLFKKSSFHTGRWHDFVVQAKWSCKDDGFVNVWWNSKQIVQYRGAVGYDDRGPLGYGENIAPQFKFGLYRDDTDKTYVAYFNHVKSGDSPQEVDFDPSTATQYSKD